MAMKIRLYIIAGMIGCMTLLSCSITTTDAPDAAERLIEFGTSVSRGIVETTKNMNSFLVWGGYDGEKSNTFAEVQVSKNPANVWAYEGTRYWASGKSYDFYAFYPADIKPDFNSTGGCFSLNNYTLDKADRDLMAAAAIGLNSDTEATKPVPFLFRHLLTQVDFVVNADPETVNLVGEVKITSARFYGIHTTANYDGSSFAADDTSLNGVWTPVGEAVTQDNTPFKVTDYVLGTTGKSLFNAPLLLFPMLKDESVFMDLKYTIGSDPTVYSKPFNLSVMTPGGWLSGKSYRYRITIIDNDHILFEKPTVNQWNTGIGGIVIVE